MQPDDPPSPADLDRPRTPRGGFWDRQLRARIGHDLQKLFEDALEEPVPEHLRSILGKMEAGGKVRPPSES